MKAAEHVYEGDWIVRKASTNSLFVLDEDRFAREYVTEDDV